MEQDYIQRPVDEAYARGINLMGTKGESPTFREWVNAVAHAFGPGAALRGGVGQPILGKGLRVSDYAVRQPTPGHLQKIMGAPNRPMPLSDTDRLRLMVYALNSGKQSGGFTIPQGSFLGTNPALFGNPLRLGDTTNPVIPGLNSRLNSLNILLQALRNSGLQ